MNYSLQISWELRDRDKLKLIYFIDIDVAKLEMVILSSLSSLFSENTEYRQYNTAAFLNCTPVGRL